MKTIAFLGISVCLGVAAAAPAATEVDIRDFEFSPATVVIDKGEDVKWTNVGFVIHTATSDTGVWDSGDMNHGEDFQFRFTATGTYDYHCGYHPSMTGTVRVTETAVEPMSFGRVKALYR